SPTIAELASELAINRSTTFEHIEQLRGKGLLSASPGRARSLILTSKARKLLEKAQAGEPREAPRLPVVGIVAAGAPIEAIENRDYISVWSHFNGGDGDTFALEVRGDSMIGEDIHEGDYVICRRKAVAENGRLVVAIVDDENSTLKRFYREKDRVRLEPANGDYDPIYSDNCRIEGVVVGLIRKL
ncbi:MAG: repressor LexA, partial [Phycisphaerales bacterium]